MLIYLIHKRFTFIGFIYTGCHQRRLTVRFILTDSSDEFSVLLNTLQQMQERRFCLDIGGEIIL